MMRDRRVVTGAFVMPVFLIVMMVQLFGFIDASVKKPKKPSIALLGDPDSVMAKSLVKPLTDKVLEVETASEGEELVRKGKARVFLRFSDETGASLATGGARVTAVFDPVEPLSAMALGTVRSAVQTLNEAKLKAVLTAAKLDSAAAEPLKLESKETKKPEGLAGSPFLSLLPYFIVLWAFMGGTSIVGDLIAGEKERGTMETLLVSPASRMEVALGKFLALSVVCLVSSLMSVVAILAVGLLGLGKGLFPTGFGIAPGALFAMGLVIVPLVLMFAGVLASISAAAKNMRESQTYLTLANFVVIMPAVFSQVIGLTDMQSAVWVKWTPVLGAAVSLRESLLGKTDWPGVAACATSSLVIAAVMLAVTVHMFRRESIVARS